MELTREDIVRMANGMHAASMLLFERNEKLEQLCRDLYYEAWTVSADDPFYADYREAGFKPKFKERMEQLGLLEDRDGSTKK